MFEVDGVLLRGRFDAFHQDAGGAALVVDYKTNRLGDRSPDQLVDRSYGHQVAIYALAALLSGAGSVEVAYAFLDRPDAVSVRSFTAADAERLQDGIRDSLVPIREGRFDARPGPHCAECPALDLLCAGSNRNREIARELTVAEKTVKTHVSNVLMKLGVQDRTQAALYAARHGLDRPGR